ncbi:MAG: hypothetical protein HDS75_08780 [Bacteroidales bacterium]|nr:hypothetical protein [Bacteroidales bacterium]MDE6801175.1 hypothetical protein [Muribaculaceae bacterium]
MKISSAIPVLALAALSITSCGSNNEKATMSDNITLLESELRETIASQDSILAIMNSIGEDMTRLKEVEGIVSAPSFAMESPERQAQITGDIAAIQNELATRRAKLAELERKLSSSNTDNANLKKAIATLKSQIDEQESTIKSLRSSLADAKIQIESLNRDIDLLNERVDSVNVEKDNIENQLTNELNTAYYALGNKKELKEHKLIETGFLRKTKVLPGDFEEEYFTKVDKRTLSQLPLLSKKAKVITNQPQDSYNIETLENGLKVLNITDPDRFWAISNFLVIQID